MSWPNHHLGRHYQKLYRTHNLRRRARETKTRIALLPGRLLGAGLGVHGNAIFHILPLQRRCDYRYTPQRGYRAGVAPCIPYLATGGDLLIAFLKNYRYGLPRFCAAALVAGSLSRTLRQGLAALNAQFMSAFTAAPL